MRSFLPTASSPVHQSVAEPPDALLTESDRLLSPYWTTPEAAMYLRTTVQGIYSLVKRGRLQPMPGSGKLLFTREALDACLRKRRRH